MIAALAAPAIDALAPLACPQRAGSSVTIGSPRLCGYAGRRAGLDQTPWPPARGALRFPRSRTMPALAAHRTNDP